jgi:cell division protease FtsH
MVAEYGMSSLGLITYGRPETQNVFLGRDISRERNYSEEVAAQIDKEVKSIIDECYSKARQLLSENIAMLKKVAEILKERENLEGTELDMILEGKELLPKEELTSHQPDEPAEKKGAEKQAEEPKASLNRPATEQQ